MTRPSPGSELTPAFPEWLKRRLPALRAEETNGLYRAFRERRLRRSRRRDWFQVWGYWATRGWLVVLITLLAVLVCGAYRIPFRSFASFVFRVAFWTTAPASMIYAVVSAVRRYSGHREDTMPLFLTELFDGNRGAKRPIVDLYLCGLRGEVIAEALLLERYERIWRERLLLVTVLLGAPFILLGAIGRENWSPVGLGFVAGCVPLAFAAITHTPGGTLGDLSTKWMRQLLARWEARDVLVQDVTQGRSGLGRGCLVAFLVLFGFPCLAGPLSGPVQFVVRYLEWLPIDRLPGLVADVLRFLPGALLLGIPGVVIARRRFESDRRRMEAMSAAMRDANVAFDVFVHCRVMEDADGRKGI